MRDERIETLVRLNTISPIILTKYVVRSMMSERAGRIVNISSIVSSSGYSGLSALLSTKASLIKASLAPSPAKWASSASP